MFSPTQLVLLMMMTWVPSNQDRLEVRVSRKPTEAFSSSPVQTPKTKRGKAAFFFTPRHEANTGGPYAVQAKRTLQL